MRSTMLLIIIFAIYSTGCNKQGPIIIVKNTYSGAYAQMVADMVAKPIEQHINGAEGMLRMESESRNDGTYTAYVHFKSNIDPDLAIVLVQNRVALAIPMLPEEARNVSVSLMVKNKEENNKNMVCITLIFHGDPDIKKQKDLSDEVCKKISADGAIVKPELFPGMDEKEVRIYLDRQKCAELGISIHEFQKVFQAAATKDVAELKLLKVTSANGDTVTIGQFVDIKLVDIPGGVYRVDMYQAVRITGLPPKGKTPESAASRCIELADVERKKQENHEIFQVLNLTGQ
jgi:multidrug efflux pump subunit AcrB